MSSHRRAGVGVDTLQACEKIALDGPKTDEFVRRRSGSGPKTTLEPTPLSGRSQNFYFSMFGGKKFSKGRSGFQFQTARKGRQSPGSMAHALAERRRELQRPGGAEPLEASAAAAV